MPLLFRFYCAPFAMMRQVSQRLSFEILFVHIVLLALGQLYLVGPNIGQFILFFCLMLLTLFVQTLIVDFVAHLVYGKSHSLRCFSVLSLSWFPTLLDHAVFKFSHLLSSQSEQLFMVWTFLVWMFIFVIQVYGIRTLYQLPTRHAILIFLSPILLAGITFILFLLGVLLS